MNITLTQMQYILAVYRTKHFGKAAQTCFVSQPTLSFQLQKAEAELGITLFDRSKKPIKTTDKGEAVIEKIKRILKEYDDLKALTYDTQELTGEYQLGVIPTLSPYVIPLFIESFSKTYPKIRLTIHEYKTEDIIAKLRDDQLDAGLLVTPLNEPSLHESPLFYEPFYIYTSHTHPLYHKTTITEKDLDPQSIWLLNEGHCFRNQVINICSITQKENVLPNVEFASGNLETLIRLIQTGHGYTLLPYLATTHLPLEEQKNNLKSFSKKELSREVSLVRSRTALKQDHFKALQQEIMTHIPQALHSKNQKTIIPL